MGVGDSALWGCMCQYGVCSIPPLAISPPAESSQIDGGNEDTLSQKVYGELSVLCHFCFLWGVSVKSLPFSAEPRPPASHLKSTSYTEFAQQDI